MKLERILDNLNSLEKNSFIKILDNIITNNPKLEKQVDELPIDKSKGLKNVDSLNITNLFKLCKDEFRNHVRAEFQRPDSQLDILSDILTRDGRCISNPLWFYRLYEAEIAEIAQSVQSFKKELESADSKVEIARKRDYLIYRACIITAYQNDDTSNQERKITADELSILITLSKKLELSQEERKLINYSVLPIQKKKLDEILNELKNAGVLFFSKKLNTIYLPLEIVRILREIRGMEVTNKYYRRVLRLLKDPQVNMVCRKHGIDRNRNRYEKIEEIINRGISFSDVLTNEIFKEDTPLNDRKKYLNGICEKGLSIDSLKGSTLEEKTASLIDHFAILEEDDKVNISLDGYSKLLKELFEEKPEIREIILQKFDLQDQSVLDSKILLDYNLKPRDLLDVLPEDILKEYRDKKGIKSRGDIVLNILEFYKDAENIYLENYENIAYRNQAVLKENGIQMTDAELGSKFEDLSRTIFGKLGFNVDEKLRKGVNTSKDKIDVLLNLGDQNVILVECKSIKERGYNKFSSVYRQMKAYKELLNKQGYTLAKSLLVAPEFTDEFVTDCEVEYELNLSLLTADTLVSILDGFKESKLKEFPYKLLMRDVQINKDRILKAIK